VLPVPDVLCRISVEDDVVPPFTIGITADVTIVGVVIVGDVPRTTSPVPVAVLKSVYPASQSAAVVRDVPMQVAITVVPGMTVITRFPPDEFTVRFPVELLTMWNVHPVARVLVTGRVIV
jgi:hypothetical protein